MTPAIVFVPGVWDLLHAGHINILWRAKQLGDVLVVGVVSSDGVREYKDREPVQDQHERLSAVRQLSFVDVAVEQLTTDPTPLLLRFRPKMLVHGDDWEKLLRGQDTVEELGIEFVRLPYTQGVSTTLLRAAGAKG